MNLSALKNKMLRMFGLSVISQVMLSLTSFAAGILMIRYTSDSDYGYYVLAQSAVLLAVTITGAWVVGPLAVLASKRDELAQRAMIGRVEQDQRRWLLWLAPVGLVLTLVAGATGLLDAKQFWVVMAAGLGMLFTMHRDLLRVMLMIQSNLKPVFWADMFYAGSLLLMVGLACLHFLPPAPVAVFGFALGSLLAALFGYRAIARNPGWLRNPACETLEKTPWQEMRPLAVWSTVGAVIYWLFAQGYNTVLAIHLDAAAVAAVGTIRLLLMPTYVLTMGVQSLLIPTASRWLHEHGLSVVIKRLSLAVAGILLLNLAYFAVLWPMRDWVSIHVLNKIVPHRDEMILLWAVTASLFVLRDIFQAALLALEAFKPLAWLSAFGAAAALSTMWVAIDHVGMVGALWGLIVGEAVNLTGTLVLLYLASARARRARVAAAAG